MIISREFPPTEDQTNNHNLLPKIVSQKIHIDKPGYIDASHSLMKF